ncbi:MAG: class I SAM-dependent methyltransferase [Euryarchaeota archaeon]|nr:class I SAM-dependent methyltransferase [Euryarchaeota archaeon]
MPNSIKSCYGKEARKEWNRLAKDTFHRLEFDTTMHFLERYLPRKGIILDAGCGPGRYSIELTKRGYDVVLLDITPEMLDFAKQEVKKARTSQRVKGVVEGSILDLADFQDGEFEAVLCLGSVLGHIKGAGRRANAMCELRRVAKKGAPIFVSVVGKVAVLKAMQLYWQGEIMATRNFKRIVETGDDHHWHTGFYCHFFMLDELQKIFENAGIKVLASAGLEGISIRGEHGINKHSGNAKIMDNWMWAHGKLCTDPTVAGGSEHILIVGRKV